MDQMFGFVRIFQDLGNRFIVDVFVLDSDRRFVVEVFRRFGWLKGTESRMKRPMHFVAYTDDESVIIDGIAYCLSDETGANTVARLLHLMVVRAILVEAEP